MVRESQEYHVLLPHAARPCLLLLPGAAGWTLPSWRPETPHYFHSVGHINQTVAERFGPYVTTLRCLGSEFQPETGRTTRLYALENHSPEWEPATGEARWVARDDLDALPLARPEFRALLTNWFAEAETGRVPILRPPWTRPGWFASASVWIQRQIDRAGLVRTTRIAQSRAWERSCVLLVGTNGGDLYFKASPAMFAHEPKLTEALARQYPSLMPDMLAVDAARRWMLTRDFGGVSLDRLSDPTRLKNALRLFASLQIEFAARPHDLLALGCPERRLAILPDRIDALLNTLGPDSSRPRPRLSGEKIARLRALAPRFRALCADLMALGIPDTLEHGDLWPGNIIATDASYIFFDWSDGSLAHPFFSLLPLLDNLKTPFPDRPDIGALARDAYLEPWTAFASPRRLRDAFAGSQVLAALHCALTYRDYVLPHIEADARWELDASLDYYLRRALQLADALET